MDQISDFISQQSFAHIKIHNKEILTAMNELENFHVNEIHQSLASDHKGQSWGFTSHSAAGASNHRQSPLCDLDSHKWQCYGPVPLLPGRFNGTENPDSPVLTLVIAHLSTGVYLTLGNSFLRYCVPVVIPCYMLK